MTAKTIIAGHDQAALSRIGITISGNDRCIISVSDPDISLGVIKISNQGDDTSFLFGVPAQTARVSIRISGNGTSVEFPDYSIAPLNLVDVWLRSDKQRLFWGKGSTAVGARIEINGVSASLEIGNDCMLSSNVWIRNHDMHTIFDTISRQILNQPASSMIIEDHVWIGFGAFILAAERIGYGSIVAALSLVKQSVQPETIVGGIPAKLLRENVSWSRASHFVPKETLDLLDCLRNSNPTDDN